MNTVSYIERKKYVRYDANSYLLYLNEAPADVVVDEESGETARGYSRCRSLRVYEKSYRKDIPSPKPESVDM